MAIWCLDDECIHSVESFSDALALAEHTLQVHPDRNTPPGGSCTVNECQAGGWSLMVEGPNGNLLSHLACAPPLAPQYPIALLYLHGFPDQTVDHRQQQPTYGTLCSRFAKKLAAAALSYFGKQILFVGVNLSGSPGSDGTTPFRDKRVSKELQDVLAMVHYVRRERLAPGGSVHVVGLSTGAILGSLMRREAVSSVSVVAGLLDSVKGVEYDFTEEQIAPGACVRKTFWLPVGDSSNPPGAVPTAQREPGEWGPHELELDRGYIEEFLDGRIDVMGAVTGEALPPMLVIHGTADVDVPLHNGQELFAAASEPKTLLVIQKANHLLTSTSHFKKAAAAVMEHIKHAHGCVASSSRAYG